MLQKYTLSYTDNAPLRHSTCFQMLHSVYISISRLLLGAPRGNSSFLPKATRPGAIHRCSLSPDVFSRTDCVEIQIDSRGNYFSKRVLKWKMIDYYIHMGRFLKLSDVKLPLKDHIPDVSIA